MQTILFPLIIKSLSPSKFPHAAMFSTPFLVTLLLAAAAAAAATQDLAACLSAAGIHNFTTGSPSFKALLTLSIQNLRFSRPELPKPTAVILPTSRTELQSTILCCRRASLTIRIRSNGHSYEGLSYLAGYRTRFAVIDLMNLNRVRVDLASNTAWVEAGATLGEAYHAVATASGGRLGFSAGSCPTVGAGGHIAGGGFGLMSRKHGLAADGVVDAVLIDAEGRALERVSMGDDVFWAIRGGGGGGWGAVYAWRIQLVPVPARVACFVVNRPGTAKAVAGLVDKWQRTSPSLPDEFYLSAFVGAGLPDAAAPGMSTTFKGFYLGPKSEAKAILDRRFPEAQVPDEEWREMSWIESILFFSGLPRGSQVDDLADRVLHSKNYFKAKSDYVRANIPLPDLIGAFELLEMEPKAYLILDPYGGAMERIKNDHLPFPHRKGNLYAIQHLIEWNEGEDEKSKGYIEWLRGFYDHMEPFVSKGPRAAYVNYLDLDLGTTGLADASGGFRDAVLEARVWGEKYFLGNYDRLVRAKTIIDPNNVFNNDQSIPPLPLGVELVNWTNKGVSEHSVI